MNNMASSSPLEIRNLSGKSCTITVDTAKVKKVADLCSWSVIEKLFDEDQLLPPLHRIKWFVCANATTTVPGSKASKDSAASEGDAERPHGDRKKEEYCIGEEEPFPDFDHYSPNSHDAGRGSSGLSERSRSRSPRREQQDEPQLRVAEKDEDVIFGDDENPIFYQFAVVPEEFSHTWESWATDWYWRWPERAKSKRPWADFRSSWQLFVELVIIGHEDYRESWWKLHELRSFIYDQTWLAMIDDGPEAEQILANCLFPVGTFPPRAHVFGDTQQLFMGLPPKLCFELLDLPLSEWRKHARASGGKAFTDEHRLELATRAVQYRFTRDADWFIDSTPATSMSCTLCTKMFRRALQIAPPSPASVVGMLEEFQSGSRRLVSFPRLETPPGMSECVSSLLSLFGTRGEVRHFCDQVVESVCGVAAIADRWRKQAAQRLQQRVLGAPRSRCPSFHLFDRLREQVELFLLPSGTWRYHSGRTRVNQSLKWLQMLKNECNKMHIDHGLDEAIKDLDRLCSRLDFSEAGGSLRHNTSGLQVFEDLGLATQFRDAMKESGVKTYTEEHPLSGNKQKRIPFTWDNVLGSLRGVADVPNMKGFW
ncbi:unnamed protein product [Amoebophrya sp. A120]|nr:unnamed protein product [Amoebophrya sp. A120]|eukprot:GSA120T00024889001.1